jgi:hypothetical protein
LPGLIAVPAYVATSLDHYPNRNLPALIHVKWMSEALDHTPVAIPLQQRARPISRRIYIYKAMIAATRRYSGAY